MVQPNQDRRLTRRLRVGVAGLGRMGRYHAENLAWRTRRVELVRVMDAMEATARAAGEELDVAWGTSFEDLVNDAGIEAVIIATPSSTHAELVIQAAGAGKHIFCEKPISIDLESTRAAIDAARAAEVRLQVGFHRRFDPDWASVTHRIRSGELGRVYLFRTSLRDKNGPPPDYRQASGSFFVDTTIHDFDAARWMVGEISEVSAMGAALSDPAYAESGQIDNAVVTLRFTNGGLGVIDGEGLWARHANPQRDLFDAVADDGVAAGEADDAAHATAVFDALLAIDPDRLTPREALDTVYRLQRLASRMGG